MTENNQNIVPGTEQAVPQAGLSLEQAQIAQFDPASGNAQTSEFESLTGPQGGQANNITTSDFYPSGGNNINKGSVGTKTFGSTPVFVADTGLAPLGVLEKREAALAEARARRQARQSKLNLGGPPQLKDVRFQKSVDNAFLSMVDKFKKEAQTVYGDDWDLAIKSDATDVGRRFNQSVRDLQTLKREADTVTTQAADIISKVQSGEITTDDNTYKLANDIFRGLSEFEKGNATDLSGKINQFKSSVVLDQWLNKNILAQLKMSGGAISKLANAQTVDGYIEMTSTEWKNANAQADGIAKRLKETTFKYDDLVTEKQIADAIKQRMGSQYSKKVEIKKEAGPSAAELKAAEKKEKIDYRYEKVTTLKNPFEYDPKTGKSLEEPSAKALEFAQAMVGGRTPDGRLVNEVTFRKGRVNPDLQNATSMVMTAYGIEGEKDSVKDKNRIERKFVGKQYSDGTVSGEIIAIDFDKEAAGDEKAGAVYSIRGKDGSITKVTYDLTDPSSDKKMQQALKGNDEYADQGDAIVLGATPTKTNETTEYVIDLTKEGAENIINSVYNSSVGEDQKIDNDDLLAKSRGEKRETTVKQEVPVQVKEQKAKKANVEAQAKKLGMTVEDYIKAVEEQKKIRIIVID